MANTSAIAVVIVAVMMATTAGAAVIVATHDDGGVTVYLYSDQDDFKNNISSFTNQLTKIGGKIVTVDEYIDPDGKAYTYIETKLPESTTFSILYAAMQEVAKDIGKQGIDGICQNGNYAGVHLGEYAYKDVRVFEEMRLQVNISLN